MNVLLIGSGGREHALAWKLRQSSQLDKLYVAPGNPGTEEIAENVPIEAADINQLANFALQNKIDLTIIGPDDPLALGIVDLFIAKGLRVFGPTRAAARVESSKSYAKALMGKTDIPTADFRTFDSFDKASAYLQGQRFPLFIKASGLAQGKGAVHCSSLEEGTQTLTNLMVKKTLGDAGRSVVIESYLDGPEVSLHALCDAENYVMFPSSQDHKPVFDNDRGPNTGGMGTVAPLPWVDDMHVRSLGKQVVGPLLVELQRLGTPFKGLLYPGLKLTSHGDKVIEYNARFGDPETQVYMRLLDDDLLQLITTLVEGRIKEIKPRWRANIFAVNIAIASGGYPDGYKKGLPITGVEEANAMKDVVVFQAGTAKRDNQLVTNGGRVLYVSATGNSIEDAQKKAYDAVHLIFFEGMHFRKDIGDAAIKLSMNMK
jgi:phosphoribosylamine--glycine ligase